MTRLSEEHRGHPPSSGSCWELSIIPFSSRALIGLYCCSYFVSMLIFFRQSMVGDPEQQPPVRDVCIYGPFYGRNFNRMMAFSNAICQFTPPGSDGNTLWVPPEQFAWYTEWFETEANLSDSVQSSVTTTPSFVVRPLVGTYFPQDDPIAASRSATSHCDLLRPSEDYFRGRNLPPCHAEDHRWYGGYHEQYIWLWDRLKASYKQMGFEALQYYKQEHAQQIGVLPEDIAVVTVHARWNDGEAIWRYHSGKYTCHYTATEEEVSSSNSSWLQSCMYTEEYVRQHLPVAYQNEKTVIVLLSDGQRPDLEETFSVKGNKDMDFFTEVALMTMSDYHFGSVMSTVDYVVAHWRRGKPVFPESCFGPVVKRSAEAGKVVETSEQNSTTLVEHNFQRRHSATEGDNDSRRIQVVKDNEKV